MDKTTLGFIADVLYIKGQICYEEYEAIMDAKSPQDLDVIVERLLGEGYNAYKKGESYIGYKKL